MASSASVHGNINHAMRQNYDEFGVDEYYRKVASSYRNPFFPGIKKSQVVFAFLNRWWEAEGREMYDGQVGTALRVLDMAAGSGEATICLLEWEAAARGSRPVREPSDVSSALSAISSSGAGRAAFIPPNARRQGQPANGKALIGSVMPRSSPGTAPFVISATDPTTTQIVDDQYTTPAYIERTSRPCLPLSFTDLSSGTLPPDTHPDKLGTIWDLIICSFALHLVPESEMFPLCYELSGKARWLVVIAPHKKPEIKEGWGWIRWDLAKWEPAGEALYRKGGKDDEVETELEIVRDKVKLRLYRSSNV